MCNVRSQTAMVKFNDPIDHIQGLKGLSSFLITKFPKKKY